MKIAEIRAMQMEQLRAKLSDTREELLKLRFQQITGQLTDSSRLRTLRRDIARMETILNQDQPAVVKEGSRIVAMSFCEPRSWTRVLSS